MWNLEVDRPTFYWAVEGGEWSADPVESVIISEHRIVFDHVMTCYVTISASNNRKQRGESKPETFTFLGFTHYCGKRRKDGAFTVWRTTAKKRMVAKLLAVKAELVRRRHEPKATRSSGCRRFPAVVLRSPHRPCRPAFITSRLPTAAMCSSCQDRPRLSRSRSWTQHLETTQKPASIRADVQFR